MSERKLIEELRTRGDQARRVSFETNFFALPEPVQSALYGLAAEVERAADAIEGGVARKQRKDEALRHLALTHEFVGTIFNPRERHADDCPGCLAEEALAAVPVETQEAAEPVVVDSVNDRYAIEHPHGNWRVATPEERAQEAAEQTEAT